MATISSNRQGYTATKTSGANTQLGTTSDMYTDGTHMGVVEFTTSINSALGTSAATFADLNITSATIKLKSRAAMASSTFTLAVGPDIPPNSAGKTIPSSYTTCSGGTRKIAGETVYTFNLLPAFQNIPANSSFTPSKSKWYFVIKSSISTSGIQTFHRRANYVATLTIEGSESTSTYYYTGTEWKKVQPYYYTGTEWKKCSSYYYTGTEWKKC